MFFILAPQRDHKKPNDSKPYPPKNHIPDRGPITREHLLITIPSIRDVKTPEEKRDLFIKKLRLCSYKFDFNVEVKVGNLFLLLFFLFLVCFFCFWIILLFCFLLFFIFGLFCLGKK